MVFDYASFYVIYKIKDLSSAFDEVFITPQEGTTLVREYDVLRV